MGGGNVGCLLALESDQQAMGKGEGRGLYTLLWLSDFKGESWEPILCPPPATTYHPMWLQLILNPFEGREPAGPVGLPLQRAWHAGIPQPE